MDPAGTASPYPEPVAASALRSLWAEPRPADAAGPTRRDAIVVAALVVWSLAELVLRDTLAPRPLVVVAAAAVIAPVPWRRVHPLVAVGVAFGTLTLVDVGRLVDDGSPGLLLNSTAATLALTYALVRWGSGREIAAGACFVLAWLPVTTTVDSTNAANTVGAYGFFLTAGALGAAFRYYATVRDRDVEQAKSQEREQLARDLHDTVAHHVSGIAIQAQAGRAVAAVHPEKVVDTLASIEDAATRTLTELRAIVGVLRTSDDAELAPQHGVADVEQLATDASARPIVHVTRSGALDDLGPAVGAALYRLAQESVTNARRHATRVDVVVTGEPDHVRLTVDDDGTPSTGGRPPAGYGLIGMEERASLLGGTFSAGPVDGRGWRVEVTLPRTARAR